MGYKPKYAASQRKKQDIVRSKPEPEKKPAPPKKQPGKASRVAGIVLTVLIVPASLFFTGKLLLEMVQYVGRPKETAVAKTQDREVLADFDAFVAKKNGKCGENRVPPGRSGYSGADGGGDGAAP